MRTRGKVRDRRRGGPGARLVLLGGMAWAVLGVPAAGQEADTLTLSLDGALSIARGTNPAYRQAVNRTTLNGTEMRATWFDQVLPRPQLNLFSTQFTGNLTRQALDDFGNPVERPVTEWNYFSQTNQSLDLTWRIQGASILDALDRQRVTNLDRDAAERRAEVEMETAVRRAFWDALEERELLRAEEALVEARRTDREVADRLFTLAMRSRVDVLNAELGVEQQALAVQRQRAAYEKAKLALRSRMGDDDLGPFRLADTPLPVFDPAALDADALVSSALEANPELRQAGVAVRGAHVGVRESKRAWWPTLLFNFNVGRLARTAQGDALFDLSFDEDLDQRFYVGLQVPMFNDFFQNRSAMQRATVELANTREEERAARLRVEEAVRGALLELRSQWESLRLAERSADIAAEALSLAQEEYRIGTRTFEDLRQAIDAESGTRRQAIEARYAFVDALLALEESVGAAVAPREGR